MAVVGGGAVLSDHHGFSTTTALDHRPWLWTVGFLSLIYSALALCARVTSKWGLLWYDDAILTASYVFAWVHYGLLYRSVLEGLGAATVHLTSEHTDNAARYFFASRILLILALCLAKVSVISFTRRIFSGDMYGERWIFGAGFAITAGWGVMAVLVSSVGCHPLSSLVASRDALCSANTTRWKTITALDVLTEILLLALPIWFVSRNQIKASKKRVVAFVYSFRLLVAAFSIATMSSYLSFLNSGAGGSGGGGRDSIGLAPTIVWIEVTLCVSLITASIPSLRSFLWAFMSRGVFTMYGVDTKASAGGSHAGSIAMQSMQRSGNHDDGAGGQYAPRSGSRLRPEWLEYRVDVKGAAGKGKRGGDAGSVKSDGSQEMIIHRNVEFTVHED